MTLKELLNQYPNCDSIVLSVYHDKWLAPLYKLDAHIQDIYTMDFKSNKDTEQKWEILQEYMECEVIKHSVGFGGKLSIGIDNTPKEPHDPQPECKVPYYRPVQTNGDKWRQQQSQKSYKEIASDIVQLGGCGLCPLRIINGEECHRRITCITHEQGCIRAVLEWLQQEADK